MVTLLTRPVVIMRAEGLAQLALALLLYWQSGASWVYFAALLLAPDLAITGYLAGPRVGAATYNLFHSYPLPAALGAYGLLAGQPLALSLALIWLAHIGMDRVLGFGLKHPSAFHDTHLGEIGKAGRGTRT